MMSVKQVAELTGISVRTLQYYDEIDLFKPTELSPAGYRLYDESALESLQQILFFKELDFTLKDIKTIMDNPQFDRAAAFIKQRELLQMKRDRLNKLLGLLDKLIKGEKSMDFKEFDMSDYFAALAGFKETHTQAIIKQLGSLDAFDEMIEQMKQREQEVARLAVAEYGSLEQYTEAMKANFQDFLANGPRISPDEVQTLTAKTTALTEAILSDMSRDAASPEVQAAVGELVAFINESNRGIDVGANYWPFMAGQYLNEGSAFAQAADKTYGPGAASYMGRAILAYVEKQ